MAPSLHAVGLPAGCPDADRAAVTGLPFAGAHPHPPRLSALRPDDLPSHVSCGCRATVVFHAPGLPATSMSPRTRLLHGHGRQAPQKPVPFTSPTPMSVHLVLAAPLPTAFAVSGHKLSIPDTHPRCAARTTGIPLRTCPPQRTAHARHRPPPFALRLSFLKRAVVARLVSTTAASLQIVRRVWFTGRRHEQRVSDLRGAHRAVSPLPSPHLLLLFPAILPVHTSLHLPSSSPPLYALSFCASPV